MWDFVLGKVFWCLILLMFFSSLSQGEWTIYMECCKQGHVGIGVEACWIGSGRKFQAELGHVKEGLEERMGE